MLYSKIMLHSGGKRAAQRHALLKPAVRRRSSAA
jgi:hypothetical protein